MQDFSRGGVLQLDAKWLTPTLLSLIQKKLESNSQTRVGVSSYMTDLSDQQASQKKKRGPRGGGG